MAWNQPGGGNGGRDPWGERGQQGPPDLDEVLKKLQERLSRLFGGGRVRMPGGGGTRSTLLGIAVVLVVLLAVWAFAGINIVEPAQQGVVLRFGAYDRTVGPGPHWIPYFIEHMDIVNVEQVRREEIGFRSVAGEQGSVPHESLMLTGDENIIDVRFVVQYKVKNARDYLYNVVDPDSTVRQATESAVREIVGRSKMDFVITEGRDAVAREAERLIQQILDRYGAGLTITSVNMQDAQPPRQVQAAFSDAVKAREDEVRLINEARAYAADILPKARGEADAIRERAKGYKQRVIAEAEGKSARFLSMLAAYKNAPVVTRERLYLDTMQDVLGSTSKVIVDIPGGNNLIYLPLDKLLGKHVPQAPQPAASSTDEEAQPHTAAADNRRSRDETGGRTR